MTRRRKRILAVSSAGGHWVQLLRICPAFDDHDLFFVTVLSSYRSEVAPRPLYVVNDATLWNKLGLMGLALRMLLIILWVRPHLVVSTGAAPGYFALRCGKWIGARTVWLDSIANVERMSLSGERVRPYADLWLTQWPHLAKKVGSQFSGAVL